MNEQQPLFGKFDVIDCLKKDEYGGVYTATHIYLGRKILLKTLDTRVIRDQAALERFKREARILARLKHPNIIQVMDFGMSGTHFYISFEFETARTLREHLDEGKIPVRQRINILEQMVRGLAYAHRQGVVHRDIKPENILITDQWVVKLADFGLATIRDETGVTNKSSVIGTPAYLSPEQIRGQPANARSDVFSLGIVTWELFIGENPFLGADLNRTINNILSVEPADALPAGRHRPDWLDGFLRSALDKDPLNRPESAVVLLEQMNWADVSADTDGTGEPVRVWPAWGLGIVILLAAVVFVLLRINGTEVQVSSAQPAGGDTTAAEITDTTGRPIDLPEPPPNRVVTESGSENSRQPGGFRTAPVAAGSLEVRTTPAAEIWIDSILIARKGQPARIIRPPGRYELTMKSDQYPDIQLPVEIAEAKSGIRHLSLDTMVARLMIRAYPWSNVAVNGRPVGQTPIFEPVVLAPGRHIITFDHPAYGDLLDTVWVSSGDTVHMNADLERKKLERRTGQNPGISRNGI